MNEAANEAAGTLSRAAISSSYDLIRSHIRRTPVLDCNLEDFGLSPQPLIFKLELLQHSGSFKARGAFVHLLSRAVPAAGVVAASGGNHGVAVALVAKKLGIRAHIFVPSVVSDAKLACLRECAVQISVIGDRYADALAASEIWAAKQGAMQIHAYDQVETLLGQGTLGLELESQSPAIDTLLVAVGGGGLIGGISAWYRGGLKIVGIEPEAAPTLWSALRAGKPVDAAAGGIAADSLAPRRVGELMFPLAQQFVDSVVLVPDDAIRQAQQALWNTIRVATEPGGAAAFAALLSQRYRPQPRERVGVILCGGNTTAVDFF